MPEGPTIVIIKESVQPFIGKKIMRAEGNTKKINVSGLAGLTVVDFRSWGKHFLICLPDYTIRIHLMMFGSCLVNERKNLSARLSLIFDQGEINFYACSVILLEQPLDDIYDWSADVLSIHWDGQKAIQKLKSYPDEQVCDALLDQHIFSGVGNIIKNEVLFRIRVHPESLTGKLPFPKLQELVKESVTYSYQFLAWKRAYTLRKHWLAYNKPVCPRDLAPFHRSRPGKAGRLSFFCPICQRLYV